MSSACGAGIGALKTLTNPGYAPPASTSTLSNLDDTQAALPLPLPLLLPLPLSLPLPLTLTLPLPLTLTLTLPLTVRVDQAQARSEARWHRGLEEPG